MESDMGSVSRTVAVLLVVGLMAWSAAMRAAQDTGGLRILVLDGEDSVNIIQQKTAVSPIVEIRDKNNLPIAGVVVTFLILDLESGGHGAEFVSGGRELALTTEASGRVEATALQPLKSGKFKIWVRARYQGQLATRSITQTNFATVEDAAKAGRTPGTRPSAQDAQPTQTTDAPAQTNATPDVATAATTAAAGGTNTGATPPPAPPADANGAGTSATPVAAPAAGGSGEKAASGATKATKAAKAGGHAGRTIGLVAAAAAGVGVEAAVLKHLQSDDCSESTVTSAAQQAQQVCPTGPNIFPGTACVDADDRASSALDSYCQCKGKTSAEFDLPIYPTILSNSNNLVSMCQ
jgi:hypothetical protein